VLCSPFKGEEVEALGYYIIPRWLPVAKLRFEQRSTHAKTLNWSTSVAQNAGETTPSGFSSLHKLVKNETQKPDTLF
jgi:hypothetical protein